MPELTVVVDYILMRKLCICNVTFQSVPLAISMIFVVVNVDSHISYKLKVFVVSPVINLSLGKLF